MPEPSAASKRGATRADRPHPDRGLRITWAGRTLEFGTRARVMGVVNCTPDSFFPGSRTATLEAAVARALEMVEAGADILDIGGESTRPGSDPVPLEQELERVIPVIEQVRRRADVLISIDTRKAAVAQRALDAGADLVNDISSLRSDPAMAPLVAERGVPAVLMHMRGEPKTMQEAPYYRDTVAEVRNELAEAVGRAEAAGIARNRLIVDPGIGFGKRLEDNLLLLRDLKALRALGCPIMIGVSRKAFIGRILELPVEDRLAGTIVANTVAVLSGADLLRVHDVPPAVQLVLLIDALRRAGT